MSDRKRINPEDDELPAEADVQAARDGLPSQEPGDEDQSAHGNTRDAAEEPSADGSGA